MPAAEAFQRFSTLSCPLCGHASRDEMPTDACQYFYDCKGCGAVLKPLPGDCCVYCSYGDVKCPPVQLGDGCCQDS
ncbi:GDCCVxC domain-containing (seleno)protein [Fodinicurvata fenggangensis]|uniref:GDCCVxC domain-containing (seleno)protein n=1 Tax=Fodinicurvata fenggangensis TaxID=1121830 RepID=UPI00047A7FA8|nr:GDCCVxC domain-containing (seleno)protein [Fodinicurvata fenggangensis]